MYQSSNRAFVVVVWCCHHLKSNWPSTLQFFHTYYAVYTCGGLYKVCAHVVVNIPQVYRHIAVYSTVAYTQFACSLCMRRLFGMHRNCRPAFSHIVKQWNDFALCHANDNASNLVLPPSLTNTRVAYLLQSQIWWLIATWVHFCWKLLSVTMPNHTHMQSTNGPNIMTNEYSSPSISQVTTTWMTDVN